MSDVNIIWEEPTPMTSGTAIDFTPQIEALRQHRGRWAKLHEYKSKNGAQDKAGQLRKQFPDCEFTTRVDKVRDSRWLYGRALPETDVIVEE